MSELSPESRALLASLDGAYDPPPEAAARVRAAVASRVRAQPPRRWTRSAGLAVGTLVLGALALRALRPSPAPPSPAPLAVVPSLPVVAPAPAVVAPAPAVAAPAPAMAAPAPVNAPRANSARVHVEPADDLAGELRLIQRAQRAIARGDGADALAALDAHGRAYPRGHLAEERQAAQVHALCVAGRGADARSAAARFVARYPTSPQVARVRGACAP
jgi:hypothetical protein